MTSKTSASLLATLTLTLALGACASEPSNGESSSSSVASQASAGERELVEAYIRQNIGTLSQEEEVLGGTFFVTDIALRSGNRAVVEYEDGHNAFRALATYTVNGTTVNITSFETVTDDR